MFDSGKKLRSSGEWIQSIWEQFFSFAIKDLSNDRRQVFKEARWPTNYDWFSFPFKSSDLFILLGKSSNLVDSFNILSAKMFWSENVNRS